MTLDQLKINENGKVISVGGSGALRQHFLDMGVIPGTEIQIVKFAPTGDPIEIMLHGYELTIRKEDAAKIEVELVESITSAESHIPSQKKGIDTAHPGLGEGGKFHPKGSGDPLPDNTLLTFALVGNQNSGKTTLFNLLTGSNQHVGNFPGVTVDRKDGPIQGHKNTLITDLPGIYSMSPYTNEELVSRSFVLDEKPKAIINIVDATNIERNLYLTMQLLEMGTPMVVALNMMDEIISNGGIIDINRLESALGVPVVPISAIKNEGVQELVDHALHVAHYQEKPLKQDFCDENNHGGAVHRCIHAIIHLIDDHAKRAGIPVRFAANKLIEGDNLVLSQLDLDQNELEMVEHIILQMEHERGLDRSAAMADMRFNYIQKICKDTVKKPKESLERKRSEKIDKILTGKYTAFPAFILIMAMIFWLTFSVIGAKLQELLETGIDSVIALIDQAFSNIGINEVLHGLIVDGILTGVGSVLSFLPIIVTLFLFLSLLEDSGYLARIAFFMDSILRKIGLSGRSIVPMLVGFGCTVPAVMSTRTLPSERDRKMTILLTPFMSCTAKLPIYAFFVNAFFPENSAMIMVELYVVGILLSILCAYLYKGTIFRGEPAPFVMELPNYRMPSARNVIQLLWEKAKDFLQRAFSIILVATTIVWFLQSFDTRFSLTEDPQTSILAMIAGFFAPLLKPLGLGDWRIVTSLISGFMAKESVVSTMEILFGSDIQSFLTSASAASMLIFSLLYTPCVAAITSIKRELGSKWAFGVVVWQCVIAWVAALVTRFVFLMIGG
ncbi:MAG: ferrous iron transport protein B [Oscillospiraceae bacterium]|nr:ferrous iron transport protein B [Oscillospiraceae bacterium]